MLPQTSLNRFTESLLKKVTSSADCSKDFVSIVASGHMEQIRHIPRAVGRVLMELPQVVKLYGGRTDIDNDILKECAKLIVEKFGFLSLYEIKEAYRQYSIGEITVKGAEMYWGEFNTSQLGKILGVYSDRRKKVLGLYLREIEEEKQRLEREEKNRERKEAFEIEFPKMIERAKSEMTQWQDVPEYWYDAAIKRGWIEFVHGEAVEFFVEAQEIAKKEMQANEEEKILSLNDIFQRQAQDPMKRAKVIARKITVFRKLIQ